VLATATPGSLLTFTTGYFLTHLLILLFFL
jgi:hypothetical protein